MKKKKKQKNEKHRDIHISEIKPLRVDKVDLTDFEDFEFSIDYNDDEKMLEILTGFFEEGDHETFFEFLAVYINRVGKKKISKGAKIPERTIYNLLDRNRDTSSENVFKIMKYLNSNIKKAS